MPTGDFPVRPWLDDPDSGSPLANPSHAVADQTPADAAGQRDQEKRLSDYTDVRVGEQAALDAAARAAHAADTTAVHGIPDTTALASLDDVDAAVATEAQARAAAITETVGLITEGQGTAVSVNGVPQGAIDLQTDAAAILADIGGASAADLAAHLNDAAGAHAASAISTAAIAGLLGGAPSDVQAVLAALKAYIDANAGGAPGGGASEALFAPGGWYRPPGTEGTDAAVGGRYMATPFFAGGGRFDGIAYEVLVPAGGSLVRCGICEDNGSGYPGDLILEAGTINTSAAGGITTLAFAVRSLPGWVWLTLLAEGGDPSLRQVTVTGGLPYLGPIGQTAPGLVNTNTCYMKAGVAAGGLPAVFPAGAGRQPGSPLPWLRAAA